MATFAYMVGCQDAVRLCSWLAMCVYKFVMVFEIFPWGSQLRFSSCRCRRRRRCRRRHRHHHGGGGNEAKGNSLRCATVKCWSYELLSQGGNCSRSMRDLEDCWRLWRRRRYGGGGGQKKSFSLGYENSLMIFKGYYCCRLFFPRFFK